VNPTFGIFNFYIENRIRVEGGSAKETETETEKKDGSGWTIIGEGSLLNNTFSKASKGNGWTDL